MAHARKVFQHALGLPLDFHIRILQALVGLGQFRRSLSTARQLVFQPVDLGLLRRQLDFQHDDPFGTVARDGSPIFAHAECPGICNRSC